METYWKEKELEGAIKETWARLRCGSVGKERAGYKEIKCSMCGEKEGTVAHICECEEVENKLTKSSYRLLKNGKAITNGKIWNAKWKIA